MKTVLALLSVIIALTAYPATILQEQMMGAGVFNTPRFKGQTFVSEDPFLSSIGVRLWYYNQRPTETDSTVNFSLFEGRGIDGHLIAQRSFTPAPSIGLFDVLWVDFDLSGVAVVPMETYTFAIQSALPHWLAEFNSWAYSGSGIPIPGQIDYLGGEYLTDRGFGAYQDLTFRVETIPEPGIVVLLLAGLAGLWFWRRGLSPQHHH